MLVLSMHGAYSFSTITFKTSSTCTPHPSTSFGNTQQKRIICNAKLNKIASNFDLDEILSNEKELDTVDNEQDALLSGSLNKKKNRRGQKRNANKDIKKKMMKEQMKQQKLDRQQIMKKRKESISTDSSGAQHNGRTDNVDDDDTSSFDIDYENLIQSIDFDVYEVPSHVDGKRIDAALVDLLNRGSIDDNGVSISRSQCGTLLSNECVFVVPPENVTTFRTALRVHNEQIASTTEEEESLMKKVPYSIFENYSSPIQRKSHILEAASILVYPSRDTLLSTSSSALLSNFIPPTEIIAQNIPLDILYEDEHMIVLNKPAGMVV